MRRIHKRRRKYRIQPIRFGLFLLSISFVFILIFSLINNSKIDYSDEVMDIDHPNRVEFTINEEDNIKTVAMRLEQSGLIVHQKHFEKYVKQNELPDYVRSGTHYLSAAMPLEKIVSLVTRSPGADRSINIEQGITLKDIATLFEEKKICSEKEFWDIAKNAPFFGFAFLDSPGTDKRRLEGYLFPGEYEYEDNMEVEDILSLMLDEFQKHFDLVPKRTNGLSDRETIILASMLQKEARSDGEKPMIASVYINRLKKDLPLQCDATIIYDKPNHVGKLTFTDYEYETPYNTYLHKGLPPTPISNVNMPSIVAASNPAKSDYYFYLFNTQTNNAHVFAKTYEEHLKNREIYGYD